MRKFVPTRPHATKVRYWTWTRGRGLRCTYTDGLAGHSDWTLPELLAADHTKGDGLPCEEVT